MKKFTSICLLGLALSISAPVFAENRAVNISIGSTGGALDNAAIHAIRRTIGQAISGSTVDTFIVYSPKVGGPIFREGGLSACAEAGFSAKPKSFDGFYKQLKSIHPKTGTFLNLELVANCKPVEPLSCGGITGKQCPSYQACVDDPKDSCDPAHGGADCSGICVAKPSEPLSCGGITGKQCPSDQACVDDPKDSCDPAHGGVDCSGICVAKPSEPVSCGGITGKPCPGGQSCVDDPKDNCDPAHGGADCSGICVASPK